MMVFSKRQLDIMALLAEGHSASKVGGLLRPALKEATVRMEIRFIADKIPGESRPIVKILRWHFGQINKAA